MPKGFGGPFHNHQESDPEFFSPHHLPPAKLVGAEEFKRSTSMGSGKGMVEKGPGAPVGPILRMPKKGAKGPGKTPVLPMPVRDDLTEASGNCSSPAGSTSAAGGSPASPGPQGEGPQPSPGPKGGPKGKGKAKGPPGVPPPKSSMPDMSPSPGPAEIPPGGTPPGVKSSPKGKGEGKGPSKGPPKGSPPAKGPGKGPPSGSPNAPAKGGGKGKGEGKTKAGPPRLQEHAPLGKKLHWKADYEERIEKKIPRCWGAWRIIPVDVSG